MVECFKCGVAASKVRLFDAISKEGIVKICEKCLDEENVPLIKRPTTFQLKESEASSTVYERLSNIAGINAKEHKEKIYGVENKEQGLLKKQEITLKNIIDKNYKKKIEGKTGCKQQVSLINNFHWIIMRARRMKKLTQGQLAKEIAESESAVKMAEQGVLPENDYRLINKIESFLGIRIIKKEVRDEIEEKPKKLDFDELTTKILTISNLKEMKKEQDEKGKTLEIDEEIFLNENIDLDDNSPEFVKKKLE